MRVSMLLVAVGLASAANADIVLNTSSPAYNNLMPMTARVAGETTGNAGDATSVRYDNWTPAPGGASALTGLFSAGINTEIADDLTFGSAALGVGRVSTIGFNLANNGPAGTALTGVATMVIRLYDLGTGNLILTNSGFGGFSFGLNLGATGLASGSSTRISSNDLGLNSWYIPGSTGVFMSITTTAVAGTGTVGYQTRAPINVGTSTDNLRNVTTNTSFNFNGTPLANTGMFINTDDVPAPGSLALLGLGGLVAARRRRA